MNPNAFVSLRKRAAISAFSRWIRCRRRNIRYIASDKDAQCARTAAHRQPRFPVRTLAKTKLFVESVQQGRAIKVVPGSKKAIDGNIVIDPSLDGYPDRFFNTGIGLMQGWVDLDNDSSGPPLFALHRDRNPAVLRGVSTIHSVEQASNVAGKSRRPIF